MIMELLSSEYGWTPNQIKKQPQEIISAYIEIIANKRLLQKNNLKKNGR